MTSYGAKFAVAEATFPHITRRPPGRLGDKCSPGRAMKYWWHLLLFSDGGNFLPNNSRTELDRARITTYREACFPFRNVIKLAANTPHGLLSKKRKRKTGKDVHISKKETHIDTTLS